MKMPLLRCLTSDMGCEARPLGVWNGKETEKLDSLLSKVLFRHFRIHQTVPETYIK